MIGYLNSVGITNTMITSMAITIFMLIASIVISKNIQKIPTGVHNAVGMGIEMLYGFFEGVMGKSMCKKYFPLVGTLFIYILVCNYSGLLPLSGKAPGFAAPTSDINFTGGMAILVFILVQVIGFRERGFLSLKRFAEPFIFMLPLTLIDEFVKPVSLTFRLYGNIHGGETVIESFFELIPIGVPCIFMFLEILMGLIQALVFSLLTAIYIGEATEGEEEELVEGQHLPAQA